MAQAVSLRMFISTSAPSPITSNPLLKKFVSLLITAWILKLSKVSQYCFLHLRNIVKIKLLLSVSHLELLLRTLIFSHLDYCVFCVRLSVLHSSSPIRIPITSQSLHWLPVKFRIHFKILLLTYKALDGQAPAYVAELLTRDQPDSPVVQSGPSDCPFKTRDDCSL